MNLVLLWLKKPWVVLSLLLVAVCGGWYVDHRLQAKALVAETQKVAEAGLSLRTCEDNAAGLEAAIKDQNKRVEDEAAIRHKEADVSKQRAQTELNKPAIKVGPGVEEHNQWLSNF